MIPPTLRNAKIRQLCLTALQQAPEAGLSVNAVLQGIQADTEIGSVTTRLMVANALRLLVTEGVAESRPVPTPGARTGFSAPIHYWLIGKAPKNSQI